MNNKFQILFLLGFGLWFLETWYFGWNKVPMSALESMLDILSGTLIFWGIIGDIASGITYNKNIQIKTKKVVVKEDGKDSI